MKEFKDKIAVITGAASGIGFALAQKCLIEGMKVMVADVNTKALRKAKRKLEKVSNAFSIIETDVSKSEDVEKLAQKTLQTYGKIDLVINNAGIGVPGNIWEFTQKDWEWILNVNLWGVIHGIRIFVPIMLEQNTDCHIINTSSLEGLITGLLGGAAYVTSKFGIIGLTESLKLDLDKINSKIKVSVICPGYVLTNIFSNWLNRPLEYQDDRQITIQDLNSEEIIAKVKLVSEESPGITPEQAADIIFKEIREEKFYIFTHKQPIVKDAIKERMDAILNDLD